MICRKTELIAKEGWGYILTFVLLALFSLAFDLELFSFLFFILAVLFAYIFRNPERVPYEFDEMSLLSPMDGKVTYIGKVYEGEIYKKDMLLISVKSSVLDLSIYRNPADLTIKKSIYTHGLFLDSSSFKAKYLNERVEIIAKKDDIDLFIRVIAGRYAKKIYTFCSDFKKVRLGDRSLLVTDATVDIYLPVEFRAKVALQERVRSGESVLGYFLKTDAKK